VNARKTITQARLTDLTFISTPFGLNNHHRWQTHMGQGVHTKGLTLLPTKIFLHRHCCGKVGLDIFEISQHPQA
jgi:hypothetical protein